MNGSVFATRPLPRRTSWLLGCLAVFAAATPLQAATPATPTLSRSSAPADLRAAVHQTLRGEGWVETQHVTETDPGFDPEFGVSVVVHGDTAMIGAQQAKIGDNDGQGAVYVFEKIDGVWTRTQKLVSSDGEAYAMFGDAIAFEGDTALIGAYGTVVNDNYSQGAVYVFSRVDGAWVQTQKLVDDDGHMFDNFGYSIALHGTTAMIGADGAEIGPNGFQGAAYVFENAGGVWTQRQKLLASDGGPGDIFGYSVAFEGTRAVIGAYADDGYQGAVYAFDKTDGVWTQSQKLVADDGAINAYFGYATALSGSTLLVGAWGAEPGGHDLQGSVYVFTDIDGVWTQVQTLGADDGMPHDKFGHSVALQGTTALIGADGWTNASAQGAVYVFDGSTGPFVQTQRFIASDSTPGFQFGLPVTFDGTTALVGSWLWKSQDLRMPGSAYFFELGGTPPPAYTIGGTVSGLAGGGLVLRQNGADDLALDADGAFTFVTPVGDGSHYEVTVAALPGDPAQICTVANGSGVVAGADVGNVSVTCTYGVVDRIFAQGFETSTALTQTTERVPVAQNSIACGNNDGTTAANQYWRRYDFSEHGVTAAAEVTSVEVSVEQSTGAPAMTVSLYTIPHAVTADTIDVGQLTLIGQTVVAAPADALLTSIEVPVSATVADPVGTDLVAKVSTEDGRADGTAFYIGSTPAAQTHPSFISSLACGIPVPTPTAGVGYPDMHVIEAVHVTY